MTMRLTDEEKGLDLVGTLHVAEQHPQSQWLVPVWRLAQILRRAVASEQANAKLVERIGQLQAEARLWRERVQSLKEECEKYEKLDKVNALLRDDLRHAEGERDKLAAELEEQEAEIRGLVGTIRKTWSRFFPKAKAEQADLSTVTGVYPSSGAEDCGEPMAARPGSLKGYKATVTVGPKTYPLASWAPGNPSRKS